MLPRLLLLSTTISLVVLCSLVSHEQLGTQHYASRPGQSFDRFDILPLVPRTSLKPRVALLPYFMGPHWIVDHHDFTCMLPVATAAAVMQNFYEDLAAYAAITLDPASSRYQIRLGQLLLEVQAQLNLIVDWIVIQQFALEMLKLTKRGYTNMYLINFIHRPTGKIVTFSLHTQHPRR